jgi:hypothetical protein
VLCWRTGIDDCVISEMMNILDKSFDALGDFAFSNQIAEASLARNLVARQGFAKNRDKRPIAG